LLRFTGGRRLDHFHGSKRDAHHKKQADWNAEKQKAYGEWAFGSEVCIQREANEQRHDDEDGGQASRLGSYGC